MMNKPTVEIPDLIQTQRLYLRPYQEGDGRKLYAAQLRNQEHLSRYESGNFLLHIKDDDHAEKIIKDFSNAWLERNYFFYGIFEIGTDDWAGQVFIAPTNWDLPMFTIGFIADVDHQRMGYITEAVRAVTRMLFDILGAHRIQADCMETNKRSWHLLERCGFKREGHLRENKIDTDGSYQGDYIYGLLKSDFYPETSSHLF
jgi:RimJ/RimL family protein N-acetyltransferase